MAAHVKPLPTLEFLNKRLVLDNENGHLYWKARERSEFARLRAFHHWQGRYVGRRADHLMRGGYLRVRFFFNGRSEYFAAHNIIWKMRYGTDPTQVIDHIDHCGSNNRPENLRDVSFSENRRNRAPTRTQESRTVNLGNSCSEDRHNSPEQRA